MDILYVLGIGAVLVVVAMVIAGARTRQVEDEGVDDYDSGD
jgi:hypothetical protein